LMQKCAAAMGLYISTSDRARFFYEGKYFSLL